MMNGGGGVGSSGNTTNNNNNNSMGAELLLALAGKDNEIAWEDIISSVGMTNKVKNSN